MGSSLRDVKLSNSASGRTSGNDAQCALEWSKQPRLGKGLGSADQDNDHGFALDRRKEHRERVELVDWTAHDEQNRNSSASFTRGRGNKAEGTHSRSPDGRQSVSAARSQEKKSTSAYQADSRWAVARLVLRRCYPRPGEPPKLFFLNSTNADKAIGGGTTPPER